MRHFLGANMQVKTIKLEKGEFTNFTDEFYNHDIIILSGARGSGKSYPTAKFISKHLETNPDDKFIYMRIQDKELATFASWCMDLNLLALIPGSDSVKLFRGKPTRGDILAVGYDAEGMEVGERLIGKCVSLESSHQFKSGKYDDYKFIVFEEYTHLKMHPNNEKSYVFNFLENVVSIFRERPKKIFLLCNSLKNIPLLDTAIDAMTGELFTSPLKIKIFRKSALNTSNKFLAYINGEVYDDDSFIAKPEEFFPIFGNKNFIIKQHIVQAKKFYIMANKENKKIHCREREFLLLKYFCQTSATNEFYYQNNGVEREFSAAYHELITEITSFIVAHGSRFIMP